MEGSTPLGALDRAIEAAGSQAALGKLIGVSREAIGQFRKQGRAPAERCPQISDATGVPLHELRPDLWKPPEFDGRPCDTEQDIAV